MWKWEQIPPEALRGLMREPAVEDQLYELAKSSEIIQGRLRSVWGILNDEAERGQQPENEGYKQRDRQIKCRLNTMFAPEYPEGAD